MKKILCPTDFSHTAMKAVDYAAEIAIRAGAHLSLLHVVHLPIVDTSETALVASELLGEQMRDAEGRLKELCMQTSEKYSSKSSAGFTCDYILREALLTDITEHLTKNEGYDLIVLGTTGVGNALEELLIGSNAEAILEQVNCPVLAVPAAAEAPVLNKVVYASDYAEGDKEALQYVFEIAKLFNATVDVVHVVKEATTESAQKAETFWSQMQQAFPGYPLQFKEVTNKSRQQGLIDYYEANHASLLAILRREKGFLRELFSQSLAERMTYKATVPLLVLQSKKNK
ncbi:universal stress protein [Pontibacter vulgaris]|uniref:universal stress protein n=1 Tax=Pontibacter vulgaris TaxID=2905679 RepID=UPI001FA6D401|nr:universal stress protein [Pontibacter vulgaris]